MRTLSDKEICLILVKHDFVKIRQKGSHVIMQKNTQESTLTVPVPMLKEI